MIYFMLLLELLAHQLHRATHDKSNLTVLVQVDVQPFQIHQVDLFSILRDAISLCPLVSVSHSQTRRVVQVQQLLSECYCTHVPTPSPTAHSSVLPALPLLKFDNKVKTRFSF